MIKIKKLISIIFIFILLFSRTFVASEESIYDKIDVFSEVLDKINKEYVDDVDQSKSIDAAISEYEFLVS